MTIYKIDNPLSDDGRNKINHNFEQMKKEVEGAVDEVSNMAIEKVVDSAKIEWLPPVNTFNDLDNTYPDATEGRTSMVRDSGKVYRKQKGFWVEIQQIDAGPVNEVDRRLSTEMAERATKTELGEKRDKLVPITHNDISDELRQQIVGTTAINAVPAKGSITKERLSQKIIGQEQTSFLSKGKNLFDKAAVLSSYFINTNGELIANANYSVSDFIGIKPSTNYYRNTISTVAIYDASFAFISRTYETSGLITTPSNAAYMRIALSNGYISNFQVEEGSKSTPKEEFYLLFDRLKLRENNFQKNTIPFESLTQLVIGKNLFNKKDVVNGLLDMGTGVIDSKLSGYVSSYIELNPTKSLARNHTGVFAFYDENKNFIQVPLGTGSGQYHNGQKVLVPPDNARYLRIQAQSSNIETLQLEENTVSTDYEPFGYRIDGLLYQNDIKNINKRIEGIGNGTYKPVKYPNPGSVTPEIYLPGGTVIQPVDVDKGNNIWGIRWDNKIYKSINGTEWIFVVDVAPFLNSESISGYALRISNTGRIIVATSEGRVLVSDEAQSTFTEAFVFKGGYTQNTWGFDKQGQYILMGSYLINKNAENPGREVFFSKDHGATWELIFDMPIESMANPADYHIHDVAFDPYSNMIIVVQGDTVNNQIFFSHDFGATWKKTNPNGTTKIHPTSILCFPEGIAFGSDDNPEGIYWWERPIDMADPIIKDEDIKGVKLFNIGESTLGNIAVKGDRLVTEGIYGVIGFVNHGTTTPGNPRLFATGDGGRSWHEIFKEPNGDVKGFFNVFLREEGSKVIIYATYSLNDQPHIFKAEMPIFLEI